MALAIALVLVLTLTNNMIAHAAPVPALSSLAREFLEAHNKARAEVGVGALKWSEAIANAAGRLVRYQKNKKGCQLADDLSISKSNFGANQMWSGGRAKTPLMTVSSWVQEKSHYNYKNNSCEGKLCGVYTQVVWKKSLELGCAQATCIKEKASLTICFYNPPGNVYGQRPY